MLSIFFEHILKNFKYVDYQNIYGGITVEESPLISIIISTRNRQKYAISAITSILSISANDLELVVFDNSDSKELKKYIQNNIKDARLRYKYISTPSPMTLNWDAAVGLASGKYICIIG
jgi:glycosyltransferase involved in cell wall biosynthesis